MVPVGQGTFRILEELARSGALSLNEITRRTAMSKSTVFRILTTLNQLGYIVRDSARSYYISHAINLGQLEFDKVTFVEVVPSEYALRLHERPSARVSMPAPWER